MPYSKVVRDDLLGRYSASLPDTSRAMLTSHARAFLSWLGDGEPDGAAVRSWMAKMKKEHYADATLRQDWGILRRLYVINGLAWPFRRGDAPVVREQEVYAPALDPADVKMMVDVALGREKRKGGPKPDSAHRAYLCLSTIWGLRRIEMAEMREEHLDIPNNLLFVQTAKHGRQRYHHVPEEIWPYLLEWSFVTPMTVTKLSGLFGDLKEMIGLTGSPAEEVGWHCIRRSAVAVAFSIGLSEPEVHSFYRWKRSSNNMALRYATSRMVGTAISSPRGLWGEDKMVDEKVYSLHPFFRFWTGG